MLRSRRCCERAKYIFKDGITTTVKLCRNHMEDHHRKLMIKLDERAEQIGFPRDGGEFVFPYGPNVNIESRRQMMDWAEKHGLKYTDRPKNECIHWLKMGRCAKFNCEWQPMAMGGFIDHTSCWLRNGKPAVLVSQPYQISDESKTILLELHQDPDLYVEIRDDPWYAKVFIGIWIKDQIPSWLEQMGNSAPQYFARQNGGSLTMGSATGSTKIFNEKGMVSMITECTNESDFVYEFSQAFLDLRDKGLNKKQLSQVMSYGFDIVAKLRGYKSEVLEKRILAAGRWPHPHANPIASGGESSDEAFDKRSA